MQLAHSVCAISIGSTRRATWKGSLLELRMGWSTISHCGVYASSSSHSSENVSRPTLAARPNGYVSSPLPSSAPICMRGARRVRMCDVPGRQSAHRAARRHCSGAPPLAAAPRAG